ncbi:MAG TPA: cytochrome c biogenesis protein CcsA [Edaphocola sp.]|nr:cytochrome c biogenesis protein CcsA [Edaphocola sp.]
METQFIGEQLLPGQIGQFLLVLSFVASLFGIYSYVQDSRYELKDPNTALGWKKLGRIAYTLHAFSIVAIFLTLFYIIQNHLFEYNYAWKHSSKGLKAKYLLASFWEGSEGSFLLWTFWNAVLGFFVIWKGSKWESRVLSIVLLVQAFLVTLQLGIYFDTTKIGSSAFTLLRHQMDAPIFAQKDYLNFVTDGNGLNVLLQNYWMVIHPPVLFLGFSLALFPFAYAVSALWKEDYKTWINPALRWSLATGAGLGAGIMMGGAWAYESLNFGGYWAWDPVENASLVPWIIVVAALHTLIIFKSTGRSLKITLVFFILQYVLVWYSTFLTRTGVLGDTSVHAFTGEGSSMKWHLIIAMFTLLGISIFLLAKRWKKMPHVVGEEASDSREFWMLIGSIVLLISSLHIIFMTSLPVWSPLYKKISGIDVAPPADVITYYNNIQVWFAILIALLTACAQYFKFKKTNNMKGFWIDNGITLAVSIVLSVIIINVQKVIHPQIMVFMVAAFYALFANILYLFKGKKGNIKKAGGSVTHIGFALVLIGVIFSGYKKRVISKDFSGKVMNFGKESFEENAQESSNNLMLYRNAPMPMEDYTVTYLGDSSDNKNDPPITYFKVRFEKLDPKTQKPIESFTLYPDAFVNPKGQEGLSSNPDAKHYWNKDIFIYVNSIPAKDEDTSAYHPYEIKKGDSLFVNNGYLVLDSVGGAITNPEYKSDGHDAAIPLRFSAYDISGKVGDIQPIFYVKGNEMGSVYDSLNALGTFIRVESVNPQTQTFKIGVRQRAQTDDYIVLKALVFPYVGVLWIGIIIMVAGFGISMIARLDRQGQRPKTVLDRM